MMCLTAQIPLLARARTDLIDTYKEEIDRLVGACPDSAEYERIGRANDITNKRAPASKSLQPMLNQSRQVLVEAVGELG